MPSSSRGSAVPIFVTKLTYNGQPGQVKGNEENKESHSDDWMEVPQEALFQLRFQIRLAGFSCMWTSMLLKSRSGGDGVMKSP